MARISGTAFRRVLLAALDSAGEQVGMKLRASAFKLRRPSTVLRYFLPSVLFLIFFFCIATSGPLQPSSNASWTQTWLFGGRPPPPPSEAHPIDKLIYAAEDTFQELVSRETRSLAEAAAAYRERRGRHPPPGFKEWYQFAKRRKAIVVEEFWDQIYQDLEPFWALPPTIIRKQALAYEMTISVRNGTATAESEWFWTQIWLSMIQTIQHLLPDMDLPLNAMDEPRIVVPWERMQTYMETALRTKRMDEKSKVLSEFQGLSAPGKGIDRATEIPPKNWQGTKQYWRVARRGCAPDSLARTTEVMKGFDANPAISSVMAEPHMYEGYVANFTLSGDICHQPDLQGLNGIFVEPQSVSATDVLFPLFGGSKLSVNNEILIPAPMYWNDEERFTGGGKVGLPWSRKRDQAIWRGVATGGKNRANNWKAFQRHRFVAMNNGTKLVRAEMSIDPVVNFALPDPSYKLQAQARGRLGSWVDSWANISFTNLMCVEKRITQQCSYTSPYFSTSDTVTLADQFNYKYLPDIDGNSFSGRYLGFLRSTSLPIKATVWKEWHDSRLVAWKHFVPMDNRYGDWYGIMEYFIGYEGSPRGHSAAGKRIAKDGKDWADKVLRKEDMEIYLLRLLLEYARISDERRDIMGWVDDL